MQHTCYKSFSDEWIFKLNWILTPLKHLHTETSWWGIGGNDCTVYCSQKFDLLSFLYYQDLYDYTSLGNKREDAVW